MKVLDKKRNLQTKKPFRQKKNNNFQTKPKPLRQKLKFFDKKRNLKLKMIFLQKLNLLDKK